MVCFAVMLKWAVRLLLTVRAIQTAIHVMLKSTRKLKMAFVIILLYKFSNDLNNYS